MCSLNIALRPVLAVAALLALSPTVVWAQAGTSEGIAIYSYQGADREQRLMAGAREEGTLAWYTSMATTESAPFAQAFERRYGVKVQLWRALSENVLQRALTEARSRRRGMDVVETNAPEVEALAREQVVAPFESPYSADLPAWAVPSHRRWLSDGPTSGSPGTTPARLGPRSCPPRSRGSSPRNGEADFRWRPQTTTGCMV